MLNDLKRPKNLRNSFGFGELILVVEVELSRGVVVGTVIEGVTELETVLGSITVSVLSSELSSKLFWLFGSICLLFTDKTIAEKHKR